MIDDIVRGFDPERVIVFGSVARRDEHAESDLDLLVLFSEFDPAEQMSPMGRIRSSIDAPIPIDVLVASVDDFERRRDRNGSPFYWPAREGLVIHERVSA